ncbi:MAG: sulfotransferase family 2 domain-containing protein [Microcoleaceae cyanobacterium]
MVEIISVHIPKTAGTAFRHFILEIYGADKVLELYDSLERKSVISDQDVLTKMTAIHGHFKTSNFRQNFPEAKWIVWLRHPIFRLISQYFYQISRTKQTKNLEINKVLKQDLGILEFAKIPENQNIESLYIDKMNLRDFYFVGIQEFFKDDMTEFKQLMGWSDFKMNTKNKNSHPEYLERLEAILNDIGLMNELAILNSKDMELYKEALELRAERRQESKWLQQTLADWNRSQFILEDTHQKLKKTQTELKQLKYYLKQSQPKIQAVDVIKFSDNEVSQSILKWGMAFPKPKTKIESDSILIRGWVIAKNSKAAEVIVVCNHQVLARTLVDKVRPKLSEIYPNIPEAKYSGFEITIEIIGMSLQSELLIQVILADNKKITLAKIKPIELSSDESI